MVPGTGWRMFPLDPAPGAFAGRPKFRVQGNRFAPEIFVLRRFAETLTVEVGAMLPIKRQGGNMKKLFSVMSVVVLSAACCLLAQSTEKTESAKIAGKWQMSVETPHGPMQGPLEIKQDGSKLTGTYEIEQMGSMAVTGKVEGDKVSFSLEVPGAQVTVAFTGKVEGDKMSGSSDHAGNWTATRQ
jgi:hypothetical protein